MQNARNFSLFTLGAALVLGVTAVPATSQVAELSLTSSAFEDGQPIPLRNSAYGDNVSPDLSWSGVPDGTEAFVLTVVDTSVPMPGGYVHWLAYNIPGAATGLPEGIPAETAVVASPEGIAGMTQGSRGRNQTGFFGPRPPAGPAHDYVFTVYALDTDLDLAEGLTRDQVMEAIEGHVLGQGSITGTYTGS